MAFVLKQEHLDMLNYMKAETTALLSNGDHSPHNDNVRRFDNILDIVAGICGSIIQLQQGSQPAYTAPVVEPVSAPVVEAPAPVVFEAPKPLTMEPPPPPAPTVALAPPPPPPPTYNFGPTS